MKQFRLSTFSRAAMAAVAAVILTACVHPRNDYYEPGPHYLPQVEYYDYWYYPAIGCYFDIRTNYYIYFEQGRWIRVRVLPPHLRPYLGQHVTIRSPHQRPYDEHFRHREQYPPERYKQTRPGEKGHDAWVGPQRTEIPDRDRRDKSRDQDRNGGDTRRDGDDGRGPGRGMPERERDERRQDSQGQERDREGGRAPGAGQRESRERAEDNRRPEPKTQLREAAPVRSEPAASTVPAKPPHKAREQEKRKEAAPKRDRDANKRRDDDRRKDADDSKPEKERRGPGSRDETGRQ